MILKHDNSGKVTIHRGHGEDALANAIPTDTPALNLVPNGGKGNSFTYAGERERINREANRKQPMPYDRFLIQLQTGEIQ